MFKVWIFSQIASDLLVYYGERVSFRAHVDKHGFREPYVWFGPIYIMSCDCICSGDVIEDN